MSHLRFNTINYDIEFPPFENERTKDNTLNIIPNTPIPLSQLSDISSTHSKKKSRKHKKKMRKKLERKARYTGVSILDYISTNLDIFKPSASFHNLSSFTPTMDQQEALSLGSDFIPECPDLTNEEALQALDKFERSARIKNEFQYAERTSKYNSKLHIPNTTYQPPKTDYELEGYLRFTRSAILDRLDKSPAKPTKPNRIILAAKSLANNKEIHITPADKNLGLCILNTSHYDKLVYDHLNNKTTYREISLTEFHEEFDIAWKELRTMILQHYPQGLSIPAHHLDPDSQVKNFLRFHLFKEFTMAKFHVLPKLHKSGTLKARPIVGAFDTFTKGPSVLASTFLNDITNNISLLLKDSKSFIQTFEDFPVMKSDSICSTDVSALYTSMLGEEVVLGLQDIPDLPPIVIPIVKWILENNYFEYKGKFFQQIQGMAMGTNCAVHLANIFLYYRFERNPKIQPIISALPLYKRYLDDCILIWDGSKEEFLEFVDLCNTIIPGIKFTWEFDRNKLIALDLILYRQFNDFSDRYDFLKFACYQKPLNKYNYLHYKSSHHPSVKAGFIKGELIRYVRNSSEEKDFKIIRSKFNNRLRRRGYPKKYIQQQFRSINYADRPSFIFNPKPKDTETIPFVLCLRHSDRQRRTHVNQALQLQKTRLQHCFRKPVKIIPAAANSKKLGRFFSKSSPALKFRKEETILQQITT